MLQALLLLGALSALAALLATVARRVAAARRYWRERGVPHEPPSLLFGSLKDVMLFRTTPEEALRALYERFPGERFVGFWRMQAPALLVRDPALARALLVADFAAFPGRGVRVDARADPLTAHLITVSGARWRCLRTRLSAFSSSGRLKAMAPALRRCAAEVARLLAAERGLAAHTDEVMNRFTTDVIGTCVFGLEFSALRDPASRFHALGRRVTGISLQASARRALRLLLPRVARALGVRQYPDDVTAFFCGLVRAEMDRREREGDDARADFMQLLLDIRRELRAGAAGAAGAPAAKRRARHGDVAPADAGLSEEVLAAQAFVFFLAGFDSPSNTCTFCLYELARHPEAQRRAREDVARAVRAHPPEDGEDAADAGLTYDALQDCAYLDMVLAETMRMYPSSGLLFRECEEPYRLPGSDVQLQPGTMVFVNIFAMHNDPEYFPEPERFRPERFSPEERPFIKPYTYMPFGVGPRVCIAERFALLQMKMVLARVLLAFDVRPCAATPARLQFDPRVFGLRSPHPVMLRFLPLPGAAAPPPPAPPPPAPPPPTCCA